MRAEITALAASIFINVAVFGTLDQPVYVHQKQGAVKPVTASSTQFDFIEVPPVSSLRKPLENNKIAAHNSVAQDASGAKGAPRDAAPKIETEGPADQLEQRRSEDASSPGSAASIPSTPRPPSPPVQEQMPVERTQSQREALEGSKNTEAEKSLMPPSGTASGEMTLQAPSKPKPPMPPTLASPASSPSPRVTGRAARGRIDTAAVSRARSHGAQVYGMTSFDATGSGMGKYMKNLKERIWLAWFPYLSFHYPKDFRTADAVVLFKLDQAGRVRNVQLVSTEGSPVFAAFCMEAVQRASPFGPLPVEVLDLIGKDELDVQFVFHFW